MVVFDTSVLLLVLNPDARPPIDSDTGEPVAQACERMNAFVQRLSDDHETIVIPTPVLSEVLVHAGAAMQSYLEILNRASVFRIAPFDQKAAIEAAVATRDAIDRGSRRVDADPGASGAKIKFDRQIIPIAKAQDAHTVYSDDNDVVRYAHQSGLIAHRTADLPLPPQDPQPGLPLGDG